MDMSQFRGRVFRAPDGTEYGVIRDVGATLPADLQRVKAAVFASDECGNYFLQSSSGIAFWDHETGATVPLATSVEEFMKGLVIPEPVTLRAGRVKSAWIDPKFAKK